MQLPGTIPWVMGPAPHREWSRALFYAALRVSDLTASDPPECSTSRDCLCRTPYGGPPGSRKHSLWESCLGAPHGFRPPATLPGGSARRPLRGLCEASPAGTLPGGSARHPLRGPCRGRWGPRPTAYGTPEGTVVRRPTWPLGPQEVLAVLTALHGAGVQARRYWSAHGNDRTHSLKQPRRSGQVPRSPHPTTAGSRQVLLTPLTGGTGH